MKIEEIANWVDSFNWKLEGDILKGEKKKEVENE